MKIATRLFAAALLGAALPAAAETYVLTLDGKDHTVELDQATTLKLEDGRSLALKLTREATQHYKGLGTSFSHPATIRPSVSPVDDGIDQLLMMTALGTGVIMQRYRDIDPTTIIDLMVKEMTDEEVKAGYSRKQAPITQTAADGTRFSGQRVRTQTTDEAWTREILAFSQGDGGYMVVTMVEDDNRDAESAVIQGFWKSLRIQAK